jgi:hypothetical protein
MHTETAIPARFNGPPASGNGGYSCGVLAAHVQGSACVRLHVPPPLDTPLLVRGTDDGGAAMYDGETLVASAIPATLDLDIPAPPSVAEAEAAMDRFPCYEGHLFPTCFVCGPERPAHDGLGLFPGSVSDGGLFACVWRPKPDMLDGEGNIRTEILWSALDCPGYFAAVGDQLRPAVLGELIGELHTRVLGDQPLIVYAWPMGDEGRKFYAGTAIATAAGTVVASAKSTWILLKTQA